MNIKSLYTTKQNEINEYIQEVVSEFNKSEYGSDYSAFKELSKKINNNESFNDEDFEFLRRMYDEGDLLSYLDPGNAVAKKNYQDEVTDYITYATKNISQFAKDTQVILNWYKNNGGTDNVNQYMTKDYYQHKIDQIAQYDCVLSLDLQQLSYNNNFRGCLKYSLRKGNKACIEIVFIDKSIETNNIKDVYTSVEKVFDFDSLDIEKVMDDFYKKVLKKREKIKINIS